MDDGTVDLRAVSHATIEFHGTCWWQVAILDSLDTVTQLQTLENITDIHSFELKLFATSRLACRILGQFLLKRRVCLEMNSAAFIS